MKKKINIKWLIRIVLISIVASVVFTLASTEILGHAGYIVALIILAIFMAIGIIFDIVGIAIATANEAPFHSMAAHRESGAAESLGLIKNADKVAGFCNDLVGDVSGIVSGATAALIASTIMKGLNAENLPIPLLMTGLVSGLTVGGKALGKTYAFNKSTRIVLRVGKLIHVFRIKAK
jgi:CBS domain containing-hemolysin-like protein